MLEFWLDVMLFVFIVFVVVRRGIKDLRIEITVLINPTIWFWWCHDVSLGKNPWPKKKKMISFTFHLFSNSELPGGVIKVFLGFERIKYSWFSYFRTPFY